jgi:hypothetical protein
MAPCQLAPARPTGVCRRRTTGRLYPANQRVIGPSLPHLRRIVTYEAPLQQTPLQQTPLQQTLPR